MRLADALAAMPPAAFERLLSRRGVTLDPGKRLPPAEQAARALAVLPAKRLASLPASAQEVMRALTPRPGHAPRAALGGGALPLVELGLVFPRADASDVLEMPAAYRLQLPAPPAEDPRASRALLASLDAETYRAIAIAHLGRPPVAPRPLVLGDVLAALEATSELERALAALPRSQQRLLAAIEARGGEVSADELLELAKEPARWGPSTSIPKSGALAMLLSRAFLLPVGAGAFALPAEVATIVGRERRRAALRVREDLARRIARADDDPARARLADDPGPLAAALLAELTARRELAGGAAVRRSALRAAAKEAGIDPERADLLVALARAVRGGPIADLHAQLVAIWRAGGAWDEARLEPDHLRATEPALRALTPTSAVREALLELLASLPEGRFAPADAVLRATRSDLRCDAAAGMLERASRRAPGALVASVDAILKALLERSLPALGALDRTERGELVRLAAPVRAMLRGVPARTPSRPEPVARWESGGRLRLSSRVELARLLAVAPVGRAVPREHDLVLRLDRERIELLASRGELDPVRAALDALAPPDADASRLLEVEARALVPCELVAASAYLDVPDDALRHEVARDDAFAPWIVRVLSGGVLLRDGAPIARLERRLRGLGGSLERARVDGVNAPESPGEAT
ncbi:hypothetical protein [Sandaracinus amylolyticus]|uniref:hypothetical protein n=1 Tax=Sandaracinus amylolyticus TaxID=927083 RepID=UPI001F191ABD|nr:hypothetical protein [Sandaracinus amylolyticus]UJR78739.1 Hypothetical protein I5071_7700 [Sandaracinus amylolyticus]